MSDTTMGRAELDAARLFVVADGDLVCRSCRGGVGPSTRTNVCRVRAGRVETELRNPVPVAPADRERLDAFVASVRRVSPRSRMLVPGYHTAYHF
ncbi:hypothetical protein [Micromonospora sp. NPDC023644]|uniref:hypothetical protein n=1 Tax=Micromonospora sp. NPDC023644 TaxID=3154321 RepID=UPI0033C709B1